MFITGVQLVHFSPAKVSRIPFIVQACREFNSVLSKRKMLNNDCRVGEIWLGSDLKYAERKMRAVKI